MSDSLAEMHAQSVTSDFHAGRAKVAHRIDAFAEAVRPQARQNGALCQSKRGVLGEELLAKPELFSCCLRKIVWSFAFEVLADEDLSTIPRDPAAAWWEKIQKASLARRSSPGAGEDLRVDR